MARRGGTQGHARDAQDRQYGDRRRGHAALPVQQPKGFSILLQMDDPVAAQRVFDAFAEHASIGMPLQETFWARRFAALVDQFGIPWSINCE